MFNPRFGGSFKDIHPTSLTALMNLSSTRDSTSKKYGEDQPGQSILTFGFHIEDTNMYLCVYTHLTCTYAQHAHH